MLRFWVAEVVRLLIFATESGYYGTLTSSATRKRRCDTALGGPPNAIAHVLGPSSEGGRRKARLAPARAGAANSSLANIPTSRYVGVVNAKKSKAAVPRPPRKSTSRKTSAPLAAPSAENASEKLLAAGTELFRRDGYVATTVDEICSRAGVTKGAFFHHFATKEALAEACLARWDRQAVARDEAAPFQAVKDPRKRVLACMNYYIGLFSNALLLKSCLVGTTVQEVSQTHPALRDAAHACFAGVEERFKALLDDACGKRIKKPDTASLARLWMATIQGSFILAKASQDESVIPRTLEHVKDYIGMQIQK